MKIISFLICYILILNASASVEGSKQPSSYNGQGHPTIDLTKPFTKSTATNTEWRLWFIAKGTRSEGRHGVLVIDGKTLHGKQLNEKKTISGRTFVWYGTWDSRKQLFSSSGWLPEDITKWLTIKPVKFQPMKPTKM